MKENILLNVLLADDDQDDCYFFQQALNTLELSCHLKTVRDGEQLMEYLYQYADSLPDVLFLDLNMPRKNGSQCLLEIKKNDKLKALPVVIYSTSLNETIADVLYSQGAHYYIQKCEFAQLKILLRKVLTKMIHAEFARLARDEFVINLIEIQS